MCDKHEAIYTFTEDDIFVDDVTGILEVDGDRTCTNQLTQLYCALYDRLNDEEKKEIQCKIYENFVRYSGQAVYDAMNEVLEIPNYLGVTDVKQGFFGKPAE